MVKKSINNNVTILHIIFMGNGLLKVFSVIWVTFYNLSITQVCGLFELMVDSTHDLIEPKFYRLDFFEKGIFQN